MRILINLSNIKIGGGIQVALSLIGQLNNFTSKHIFYVVVSDQIFKKIPDNIFSDKSIVFYKYTIKPTITKAFSGMDSFLNKVLIDNKCVKVFTLFGPSYWRPKVPHLVGFARPHYVYSDSPFFKGIGLSQRLFWIFSEIIHMFSFERHSDSLVTENEDVSAKISLRLKKPVYTVSNTFHQVFDDESLWQFPEVDFEESKSYVLTISANYTHKNLSIIPKIIDELLNLNIKDIKFILTINKGEILSNELLDEYIIYLGPIPIEKCPLLYSNSDIVFLPSLLESFSATYAEAMKMGKALITSDLPFARGICKDAALYVNPFNAPEIANCIINLLSNQTIMNNIIDNGNKCLSTFLCPQSRAEKYIEIVENL
jgi:glycosyltransferase involved in cell wall biosynthesis